MRGHEATQDPSIIRFTHVPEGQTLAQLRVFVHGLARAAADGDSLAFVIADAATDELLGTIAILRPSWEDRRAEVGYWLRAGGVVAAPPPPPRDCSRTGRSTRFRSTGSSSASTPTIHGRTASPAARASPRRALSAASKNARVGAST